MQFANAFPHCGRLGGATKSKGPAPREADRVSAQSLVSQAKLEVTSVMERGSRQHTRGSSFYQPVDQKEKVLRSVVPFGFCTIVTKRGPVIAHDTIGHLAEVLRPVR
jgi:hypothetical protein